MCQLFLLILRDLSVYLLLTFLWLAWPGAIALAVYSIIRGNNKARKATEKWAERNGWQLTEFSWQWNKGPFTKWRRRGENYYQFAILDNEGQRLNGWVRYYDSLYGSKEWEVKWAEVARM